MKETMKSVVQRWLTYGMLAVGLTTNAIAAETPVNLRSASTFTVLAATTVTNTGLITTIGGDLGVFPGTAIDGFPPGIVLGNTYAGGPIAEQAQKDAALAYGDAAGRSTAPVTLSGNLGGTTLYPGLYKSTSSLAISSGDLTLDAQGDPNAVFIFQMASTLTTTSGRQVILAGGARAANIFWQVGSSATFGTTSVFHGNVIALVSITCETGATLNGRALALTGAVTLDGNSGTASQAYVTNVTSPLPNATYGAGELIPIEVVFNEPVTYTGFPTLELDLGLNKFATVSSGDGTTTLTFDYLTVVPDTTLDLDYLTSGSLQTAGGTITSVANGVAADLELNNPGALGSLGFNKDIVIDTTVNDAPTVLSIVRVDPTPTSDATVRYDVTFSEPVNGVAGGNFTFETTDGIFTVDSSFNAISGLDGTAVRRVTVNTGQNTAPDATFRMNLSNVLPAITDLAGNPLTATFNNGETFTVNKAIVIDTVAPTVLSIVRSNSSPTNAPTVIYDITFSEPVNGVSSDNFSLEVINGSFNFAPTFNSISGLDGTAMRQVTINTGTNDPENAVVRLNLSSTEPTISDLAGNALTATFNTGQAYTVDKTNPTVVSILRVDPNPSTSATVRYNVTFSEPVYGVAETNFTFETTDGTFTVDPSFNSITGANGTTTRQVTVNTGTNTAPDATFRMNLTNTAPPITDEATNSLMAGYIAGDTFTVNTIVDVIPPTVLSIVRVDPNPTSAATVRYDVTFSEPVFGVSSGNFSFEITDGTFLVAPSFNSITGTDGTNVRQVTVNTGTNDAPDATFRMNLSSTEPSITDTNGNILVATFNTGETYTVNTHVDSDNPRVLSIVRVDPSPTNDDTVRYDVTFSEDVDGVSLSNFALQTTDGSFSTQPTLASISGSNGTTTRRVTVNTGINAGENASFRLNLNNIAPAITGTVGGFSLSRTFFTSEVYVIDKTNPFVLSIVRVNTNPSNAPMLGFDVTFNEPVNDVELANFTIETTSGTFSVQPTFESISGEDGTNTRRITLNAGSNLSQNAGVKINLSSVTPDISDLVGNILTTTFTTGEAYLLDNTSPFVLSVVRLDPSPTSAATVRFAVTFSEPVNGVVAGNLYYEETNGSFLVRPTFNSISGADGTTTRTVTVNTGINNAPNASFRMNIMNNFPHITGLAGNQLNTGFNLGEEYVVEKSAPTVVSITRLDPNPTTANTVRYSVLFSEAVNGVADANFVIETLQGSFSVAPSFNQITGANGTNSRVVTLNTGINNQPNSTFRLNLVNALPAITDLNGNALTSTFATGESYTVDSNVPNVISIIRVDPSPTTLGIVRYDVRFSENVFGVAGGNFSFEVTDGAFTVSPTFNSISGVDGTNTRRISVNTGTISTASASFRMNLSNAAPAITDGQGNTLAALFTTGEEYTIGTSAPRVLNIVRVDPNPTRAEMVSFDIIFTAPVFGVSLANLLIQTKDNSFSEAPSFVSISGADGTSVRRVTINTGTNNRSTTTFHLTLANLEPAITDAFGNAVTETFNQGEEYILDQSSPVVVDTVKLDTNPTNAQTVRYIIRFSEPVVGLVSENIEYEVTQGTFAVAPSFNEISGDDGTTTRLLTLNTGTNNLEFAIFRLRILPTGPAITDVLGNVMTERFNRGETYKVDQNDPFLVSIAINSSATSAVQVVDFLVTLSEPTLNVPSAENFSVITSGTLTGSAVKSISGTGPEYIITVETGTGSGDLQLGLSNSNGLMDEATNLFDESSFALSPSLTINSEDSSIEDWSLVN